MALMAPVPSVQVFDKVGGFDCIEVHCVTIAAHEPNEDAVVVADSGRIVAVCDGHGGAEVDRA